MALQCGSTPLQCDNMPLQCGSLPLQCGSMPLQCGRGGSSIEEMPDAWYIDNLWDVLCHAVRDSSLE